jgi:hypothetical protein
MLRGSITERDRTFVESWENIAPSQNAIIRLNTRGDESPEVITGRRTFMLTTEERLITQDRIVDDRLDPFKNGCFRPVLVPESVSIDSNPNALSDDEIRTVFKASDLAWQEWLKVLDSPETLRRLLDLADESDISLKRYKEIATRLSEVKPKTRITQKDQDQYEAMAGNPDRPGRSRGGRSADYR